jgi:SOS-response transcriptional repressor LexA
MDLDLLRFGNLKSAIPHSQLFSKDPVTRVAQYRKVPLLSWSRVGRVRKHGLPQGEVDAEAMLETDVHGPHVFALRVRDDSMEPLFRKGEVIFVNPDLQPAHDHYVIVASGLKDGGEGKIRQLKKLGNQAFLHALNPKYADVPVTGHRIVGRVVRLRMNL